MYSVAASVLVIFNASTLFYLLYDNLKIKTCYFNNNMFFHNFHNFFYQLRDHAQILYLVIV